MKLRLFPVAVWSVRISHTKSRKLLTLRRRVLVARCQGFVGCRTQLSHLSETVQGGGREQTGSIARWFSKRSGFRNSAVV